MNAFQGCCLADAGVGVCDIHPNFGNLRTTEEHEENKKELSHRLCAAGGVQHHNCDGLKSTLNWYPPPPVLILDADQANLSLSCVVGKVVEWTLTGLKAH